MEAALASSILFQDFWIALLLSQRYHGCDSIFVTLMRQKVKTFVTLFDLKVKSNLARPSTRYSQCQNLTATV